MRRLFLFIPVLLLFVFAEAQNTQKGKLTLAVVSDQQQPLENATVEVLRKKDSILVKAGITDQAGIAEIENIKLGDYLLKISMVNYTSTYSYFSLTAQQADITLPKITLQPKTTQLDGVTVTGRKPFIQKLIDRIVVNVDNSIVSSGSTAMDVLERSPGVTVGQNDVISMAGKAGVIIMINGKIVPMTGEELGNYLRSLPSTVIERIDLITNPSARYDAAGNAGIIDIRMKKDQRLGFNGTFTANYGMGYYPKTGAGNTFNYRSKKVNLFGNLNYNYSNNFNNLITRRDFFENGIHQGAYDQDNMIRRYINSTGARVGAD